MPARTEEQRTPSLIPPPIPKCACLEQLNAGVIRQRRSKSLEDTRVEVELIEKEGQVFQREEQLRAAHVRVDERRLVHRRSRCTRKRSIDETRAEHRQVRTELEPLGLALGGEGVEKGALARVLVSEEHEAEERGARYRGGNLGCSQSGWEHRAGLSYDALKREGRVGRQCLAISAEESAISLTGRISGQAV